MITKAKNFTRIKESMQYGIPAYELNGKGIVAFNSQKNYMTLYVDPKSVSKNQDLLKGLNCGKS